MGRPETVVSGGAAIACDSGQSLRMCGLSAIAGRSSNTSTPPKLLAYAATVTATMTTKERQKIRNSPSPRAA